MPSNHIQVYTAIRTSCHIHIKGRLLANAAAVSKSTDNYLKSVWVSFIRAYSRELKHTNISLVIADKRIDLLTDNEGYFEFFSENIISSTPTKKATLEAVVKGKKKILDFELRSFLQDVPLGIISDIDDTILITRVRSFFKLRMLLNTILINPFRRKPIEAAAKYYSRLLADVEGDGPIIYVSNSPWNMNDYLRSFLQFNGFPEGELMLRDFGLQMLRKKKPLQFQNKYLTITRMLMVFPKTKFILIGDSAEKDYDIYTKIQFEYPERVDRIIIIKAGNVKNENRIEQNIGNLQDQSVTVVNGFDELLADL